MTETELELRKKELFRSLSKIKDKNLELEIRNNFIAVIDCIVDNIGKK